MARKRQTITNPEIRDALLRSGYLLESRISSVLSFRDYSSEPNSAFPDPITGKTRELDVRGRRMLSINQDDSNVVSWIFLIECVNNPEPFAFLVRHSPRPSALTQLSIQSVGMDSLSMAVSPNPAEEIVDNALKSHHYNQGTKCSQFCSFLQKKDKKQWMAIHEDSHFEAFEKLCNATEYFMQRERRLIFEGVGRQTHLTFFYPVLVLQGELLEAQHTKKSVRTRSTSHVHYLKERIREGPTDVFQIDVVRESFFPTFVQMVEIEMKTVIDAVTGIVNSS